jgi:hypothetical protein
MRYLLLALVLATAAGSSAAGEFDWVRVDPLDLSFNPSLLRSQLALTPSGEPVRARLDQFRLSYGAIYLGDFRIDHHDAGGTLVWSDLLEGEVHVKGLRVDGTGAIVLHGVYRGSITVDGQSLEHGGGDLREFLLKLDADREVEWLIDLQTADPTVFSVDALAVDASGHVWLGSAHSGFSTIRRLGADGTAVETWTQTGPHTVADLAVEPDGTVWASGAASSGAHSFHGMEALGPFTYSSYLVKYAPGGVGQWARFVEDVTFQPTRLAPDGAGNVYLAGSLHGSFAFGDLVAEGVDWVYDFFLTKIDADGEFLWLREVPADGAAGDAGVGLGFFLSCPDPDGVYFAGFSRGDVDWGGNGEIPPSYGARDVLVLEFAADGEFRWAKTAGSPWLDIADAVAVDGDGTVFLAGQVCEGAQFDALQFGGNFVNSFLAALPAGPATGVRPLAAAPGTTLRGSPNPFAASARIEFELPTPRPVRLTIHDVRGARVGTLASGLRAAGRHAVDWDGRDDRGRAVASGVYTLRLATGAETVVRRIVKVR